MNIIDRSYSDLDDIEKRVVEFRIGVSDRIKFLMEKNNMTQAELARRSNMTLSGIRRLILCEYSTTFTVISKLEKVFGEKILYTYDDIRSKQIY